MISNKMLLKILVTKHLETSFLEEFDINRFPVFIGRDEKNDIFLEDHFKIISRKHAQIIQRDNSFYLIDLESQNFTYLNGQRIQLNEDKLLQSNDKIKIGEYELEVQILKEEAAADNDQKTMVFAAPFEEELSAISENLKSIFQKFSADDSQMKNEMLRFSLMQKFNKLEKNDVNKIFAEFFHEHFLEDKFSKEDKFSNISKGYKSPQNFEGQSKSIIQQNNSDEAQLKPDYSFSSHFSDVTDVLLDAFSKLILGCLQFRQEFFGVTMYQILPVENLKDLKEYLFNPAISSEEEKKRLSLLKDETQKLLAHQIGLLEGYRISIIEGTKYLLQSLDPETLEKEEFTRNQKPSFLDKNRLFSFAQKARLLDTIKKTYGKYHSDPYHIEKKFFRPAFMKGYQRRNIAGKPQDEY